MISLAFVTDRGCEVNYIAAEAEGLILNSMPEVCGAVALGVHRADCLAMRDVGRLPRESDPGSQGDASRSNHPSQHGKQSPRD